MSKTVKKCQVCSSENLTPFLFLGYLPPVNKMRKIGEAPKEESAYPAQLLYCPNCHLVQLGLIVDATILFPEEYPYTSSTTKILRDNFAALYQECQPILNLDSDDLVVDIGSNDGNLLSNFQAKHKVLGITPEKIGQVAIAKGIPTIQNYFQPAVVETILQDYGQAKLVTATNVFAHIDNVNSVVNDIIQLLAPNGVFISESHYLFPLIEDLQFDTIYHEHLRYYSLHSLKFLQEQHGLEIFKAVRIPTHGGSIRVYACRKGERAIDSSVSEILNAEKNTVLNLKPLQKFANEVELAKLEIMAFLSNLHRNGKSIFGISAPSRASTLINYTGIDEQVLKTVLEIKGSYKIGQYVPGTLIPIEDEEKLYLEQPDYAFIFSWHIADELIPKIKGKGFKGEFIVPLPRIRVVK